MEEQGLIDILENVKSSMKEGNVDLTDELLEELFFEIDQEPHVLWDNNKIYTLAKACTSMYHRDVFLNEETNLVITHLAYLYYSRALDLYSKDAEMQFKILRDRILLLYTTSETFYDSIITILQPENNNSDVEFPSALRGVMGTYMNLMVWSDLQKLSALNSDYTNETIMSDITREIDEQLKPEDISERRADVLHELLGAFVLRKAKDKDLNF
ncbi:MAG: hypothetical protein N4A72_14300 [Bacteroidales bacterium]|jgi:hypothetical protein|nr:hypothetical protein [Bacteroidales bacterium]